MSNDSEDIGREREHAGEPPLTFEALRFANRRRCNTAFHPVEDWSFNDWVGAIVGELGEASNVIKENRRRREIVMQSVDADGEPVMEGRAAGVRPMERGPVPPLTDDERQRLAHELADVIIYIDLLAERAGIDLGHAVREKFNIVSRERVNSDVLL